MASKIKTEEKDLDNKEEDNKKLLDIRTLLIDFADVKGILSNIYSTSSSSHKMSPESSVLSKKDKDKTKPKSVIN